jgi:hypothetical protein
MAKVLTTTVPLTEIRIKKKEVPPYYTSSNYSSLELGFFAWHPPNMEHAYVLISFIFMITKSEEMHLVIF